MKAYVEIEVRPFHRLSGARKEIARIEAVTNAEEVLGMFRIIATIEVADIDAAREIISQIQGIDGVEKTSTTFVLKTKT